MCRLFSSVAVFCSRRGCRFGGDVVPFLLITNLLLSSCLALVVPGKTSSMTNEKRQSMLVSSGADSGGVSNAPPYPAVHNSTSIMTKSQMDQRALRQNTSSTRQRRGHINPNRKKQLTQYVATPADAVWANWYTIVNSDDNSSERDIGSAGGGFLSLFSRSPADDGHLSVGDAALVDTPSDTRLSFKHNRGRSLQPMHLLTGDGTPVVNISVGLANTVCPLPNGKFPVLRFCNKYVECSYNSAYVRACPLGTMYSYQSRTCEHPYRVQCVDDFSLHKGDDSIAPALWSVSKRPPLTPSLIDRPTAVVDSKGSVVLQCPIKVGLLAIPNRCNEFLNCWNARGSVQACPAGTSFNYRTEKCDFPENVRCIQSEHPRAPMVDIRQLRDASVGDGEDGGGGDTRWIEFRFGDSVAPRSRLRRPLLAPPSGQRVRLRGGRTNTKGNVQLYHEGQWSYVCEDGFTLSMQHSLCRNLGFNRGSRTREGAVSEMMTSDDASLVVLRCSANHSHISDCHKLSRDFCVVMFVECWSNAVSLCPPHYRPFAGSCYRVFDSPPMTHQTAEQVCSLQDAHLVSINSQEESNFISEMLQYRPNIVCLHTAGVGVPMFGSTLWLWRTSGGQVQYQRWWPGWDRTTEGHAPSAGTSMKCLALQNVFPTPPYSYRHEAKPISGSADLPRTHTGPVDAGYFWWTAVDCDQPLPFVCQRPQENIGCMKRNGASYAGVASVTQNGQRCLNWTHPRLHNLTSELKLNTRRIGEHNHCRNPDNDNRPWCFINELKFDYCDIPHCTTDQHDNDQEDLTSMATELSLQADAISHGANTTQVNTVSDRLYCIPSKYRCSTTECVYFSWVCDGEIDCSNGLDEHACHEHLLDYDVIESSRLVGYDCEKWLFTSKEMCARHCSETKHFVCMGFNHQGEKKECYLFNTNVALSGAVEQNVDYALYQLRSAIPDCSSLFVCPSGKCLNHSQVCDGRRDCAGGRDEINCTAHDDFEVRLVDGATPHEGRIEVKVLGRWGVVCDDHFTLVDATVVCRHLGFQLGAKQAVTNAGFGSGNAVFLMDDLNCRGDERSLTECDFAGWGRSDCIEAEVAGVRCRTAEDQCEENQWRCNNGRCISVHTVCDTVDDCGDFSDEIEHLCRRPIEVRLVGETNRSGRVEVWYMGVWGTICDDNFDTEDAQVVCRMLGHEGVAVVHQTSRYGAGHGQIWLDQLECSGHEKSLDECFHALWGHSDCRHDEDIGVSCNIQDLLPDHTDNHTLTDIEDEGILPSDCGHRFEPDKPFYPRDQNAKIVRGSATTPGAHPWMVGVRVRSKSGGTFHWCGGVVVSRFHILSAAHCLRQYRQQSYVLRVGDFDNQVQDPEEQEFSIERMYPHPDFNKDIYLNNDIIVIRVKSLSGGGIQFGRYVQPVCLARADMQYEPGRNCTISGWGSSGWNKGYARRMQSAVLPLLHLSVCKSEEVYGPDKITAGMYCAGYLEGGIDTCQGDSGGPMVCQQASSTADQPPVNFLYGMTSWGLGCARPNKPGVYTLITAYLPWIKRTLIYDHRLPT